MKLGLYKTRPPRKINSNINNTLKQNRAATKNKIETKVT